MQVTYKGDNAGNARVVLRGTDASAQVQDLGKVEAPVEGNEAAGRLSANQACDLEAERARFARLAPQQEVQPASRFWS